MFARRTATNAAWVTLTGVLVLAAAVAAQAQTTSKQASGKPTVTTSVVTGEIVRVEGNDLVVKLSSGEIKTFRVASTRTFLIDGSEVTVRDLKPGTTLTATVKTTTTPVTVRTKSAVQGRVWFVAPPATVILTQPDGQNKQYTLRPEDKVQFTVNGRPASVFDLKAGMEVKAEKIVEEPDVEITTDTKVVGQAPQSAAPATPAAGQPSAEAPAGTPPAATPEGVPPAGTQPAAPEAQGASNPLLWVGLVVVLIVIAVFVFRRFSKK
jgi:hypothetical protein